MCEHEWQRMEHKAVPEGWTVKLGRWFDWCCCKCGKVNPLAYM